MRCSLIMILRLMQKIISNIILLITIISISFLEVVTLGVYSPRPMHLFRYRKRTIRSHRQWIYPSVFGDPVFSGTFSFEYLSKCSTQFSNKWNMFLNFPDVKTGKSRVLNGRHLTVSMLKRCTNRGSAYKLCISISESGNYVRKFPHEVSVWSTSIWELTRVNPTSCWGI